MSMPKLPEIDNINREDSINVIIASIGMQELALAHVINAEGEKLQYFLGTLEGVEPVEVTICDLLAVNDSIRKTLRDVMKTEILLQSKLEDAIELDANGDE